MRAVEALAGGKSRAEAATVAGVGERTIWRWERDPAFKAAQREAEQRLMQGLVIGLLALRDKAIDALDELLSPSAPARVRLQAARATLGALLRAREVVTLENRITELEAKLGDAQ